MPNAATNLRDKNSALTNSASVVQIEDDSIFSMQADELNASSRNSAGDEIGIIQNDKFQSSIKEEFASPEFAMQTGHPQAQSSASANSVTMGNSQNEQSSISPNEIV